MSGIVIDLKLSAVADAEVGWEQCDQMARLFVQFLVIYNDENLPNSIHNLLK